MRLLSAALLAVVACAHVERHPTDVERRLAALEARADLERRAPPEEFYRSLRVPSGIFYASAPMSRINPPSFLLGQGAAVGEGGNCAEPSAACRAASFTATGAFTGASLVLTGTATGQKFISNNAIGNNALEMFQQQRIAFGASGSDICDLYYTGASAVTLLNCGLNITHATNGILTVQALALNSATSTISFNGSVGTAGQVALSAGAGAVPTWGTVDQTFCVYNTGALAGATAFGQTKFIHSATVDVSSFIAQDVAGTGAGNFVVKVCTDGATCAGGNTFLTYTEACTAAAGVVTAATVQNSGAIPANSTVTVSVATACGPDPAANVCIHYTTP